MKLSLLKPVVVDVDDDNTCSGKKCAAITFNQFAFTDTTTKSANPSLSFHMTCKISMGTARACPPGRRRRAVNETSRYGFKKIHMKVIMK